VKKLGPNKVEITTNIANGVHDRPYQCENRIGSFEAIANLFTHKLPLVEHPVCVHKGGNCCTYIVSWEEPFYLKLRRARNYLSGLLIPLLVACGFLASPLQFVGCAFIFSGILASMSYYSQLIEKKEIQEKIEIQGDTASRLLDQITESYENSVLVQEIGQALSNTLDIDRFLEVIKETLGKRLNFDRGMIMLADSDRKALTFATGYGYAPELENILHTAFHLDNPDSRGPFVSSFLKRTPILVNDINDIKHNFSLRGMEFAEKLGANSFICVPIVYEGISLGILAVDNYKSSRPLGQSGINMLMGIATQIAISLNNATNHRKLKESEERFRALSENSPDIIYTVDKRAVITYVNPALKENLGYEPKDILGKPFTDIVKKEDIANFTDLFDKIMKQSETVKHFHGRLFTRDGDDRLFNMSAAPNIKGVGEMTGVVGTLKDVTEQRRLEEQLRHAQKMNAIGQLTGGISHDFNNILQAIAAYAELLQIKKNETEEAEKYIINILELTGRGTDLVKQMMIFSRKAESSLRPLDLNREIKNCSELLTGAFPKDISISYKLADNLRPVNGDAGQIGQVIMNLAVNAKDAMPDGGILEIETRNADIVKPLEHSSVKIPSGRYVVLRISDTGSGIEQKVLEHIFEPFFTTKEVGKGTGIGLAVVYGVIKGHGGYIFCYSKVGKGTTFEISLPVVDAPIVPVENENIPSLEKREGKETILLVDDEDALVETGQELLSLSGYTVLTASSGEEVLDVLRKNGEKIDIIIMDVMMPGMGGIKCLQEVLKIYPEMKVIMASGFIETEKKRTILSTGAAGFIKKPYRINDLNEKIREVFEKV
jgi:PAS domain S-box-containing protein